MIPTIFFNRTCKKCADGTIVSAKISQDTENNILIVSACNHKDKFQQSRADFG